MEQQTLVVGRALGREAEAEKVVARVRAKFAGQDTRSRFLADLGFKTPGGRQARRAVVVSQEQFRLMDQDVVLMYGKREDVLDNPVFKPGTKVEQPQ